MRILCFIGWLALASGCASFGVRCDTRLRPINMPQRLIDAPSKKIPAVAAAGEASGKP